MPESLLPTFGLCVMDVVQYCNVSDGAPQKREVLTTHYIHNTMERPMRQFSTDHMEFGILQDGLIYVVIEEYFYPYGNDDPGRYSHLGRTMREGSTDGQKGGSNAG